MISRVVPPRMPFEGIPAVRRLVQKHDTAGFQVRPEQWQYRLAFIRQQVLVYGREDNVVEFADVRWQLVDVRGERKTDTVFHSVKLCPVPGEFHKLGNQLDTRDPGFGKHPREHHTRSPAPRAEIEQSSPGQVSLCRIAQDVPAKRVLNVQRVAMSRLISSQRLAGPLTRRTCSMSSRG